MTATPTDRRRAVAAAADCPGLLVFTRSRVTDWCEDNFRSCVLLVCARTIFSGESGGRSQRYRLCPMDGEIHAGLRHEHLASFDSGGVSFLLVRVLLGKDRNVTGLHARPHTFSTAGLQTTDTLTYLGFRRSNCTFQHGDGYCRTVADGFEPNQFSADFTSANERLKSAIGALEVCGIRVPMPEGFGYFLGRRDSRRETAHLAWSYPGDGHTALQINELRSSENDAFSFKLTYIKDGTHNGWVTHYAPKHRPLTEELRSVFEFLKLREFEGCPEFSFEKCHWLFLFVGSDPRFVEDRTALAHTQFDANANKFSSGIERLLAANTSMSPHGMAFLPVSSPIAAAQRSIAQVIRVANPPTKASATVATEFDVVISFA